MEEIFSNRYQVFYYDRRRNYFVNIWLPESQDLEDTEYQKQQIILWDKVREIHPQFVISDNTNFLYSIDPELQDWVASEIDKLIDEVKLERIGIVTSKDFIALLTIRQTIEEGRFQDITRFFETREEAESWLFTKSQAA
ncbi:hypothetical protein BKI52_08290 [marine bacterium AO1-C]|nr:hypothetical protein BKI52_08290 [marine bacterium AO1-C]